MRNADNASMKSCGAGADVTAPAAWVVRHAAQFAPAGRILDLACGGGRHTRWLLAQGFRVLAVDRDLAAIETLRAACAGAELQAIAADLEADDRDAWPLAGESFDGIVVTRYLHRPRLFDLAALLKPGGVLIYETFMQGNERFGPPRRPEFLLEPGELLRVAAACGMAVLDFREGFEAAPAPAVTQSICCRRRG